ncbi:MAG: diguanylate cyclase [Moraxellaceae bacterium]|nr:diguanylate cyclase [Moraxellaceae bacterium]
MLAFLKARAGQAARLLKSPDTTTQGDMERQLHLLRCSLESSCNGIVICDAAAPDWPIIYANHAFERMTGLARADVLGRSGAILAGGEAEPASREEVARAFAERREAHLVVRIPRKDGGLLWIELSISPITDERGQAGHFVAVLNDVTEQYRCRAELMHAIRHDLLTGLPNRKQMEDQLRAACAVARQQHSSLAVLFIDLDGLKAINDLFGHRVGDQLLVEIAHRMAGVIRTGDVLARMGGDEFIVLLNGIENEGQALGVVERLAQGIARPCRVDDDEIHLTASIGITMSDGCLEEPQELVQQADLAMYKAKQEGRNTWQWYTGELNQYVSERFALRNDLRKAIERNSLELHYQPQVDSRSGRVVAIEALLRWCHPERGPIPAVELIHAAEDAGQVTALGIWVLRTACAFNKELLERGVARVAVTVNVASTLFKRNGFLGMVRDALTDSGLPADLLEIEITESVFLSNVESAVDTLRALRELGVSVAIDDFGTGFSSLTNMRRLPLNKVKIDRAFIQNIISDRHDADITQGIISLAHHLRLKVVAEGVETEAQHLFLKKIQCDAFQGFYFSRPLPGGELVGFLRERRDIVHPQAGEAGPKRQTLLLLDDEENVLRALARVLRRDRYEVLMAGHAQEAFEILAKYDVQVIISDQRMPEMSGTEFLSRVKGLYPDTVRMVLSGYTDLGTITDAINQGEVYKFLLKPWDDENLRSVVSQAFRQAELARRVRDST